MKHLVVLGAGTAGTMVVNKLHSRLDHDDWRITIVDQDDVHHYQPGYLFIPFGTYEPGEIVHSRHHYIPDSVEMKVSTIDQIVPADNKVLLADGSQLIYDQLVIATGTSTRPDQTPGMAGDEWRKSVFDFYTFEGSQALKDALDDFESGRLVVHITEMPIKCPVAPLEFTFLADAMFRGRGTRDQVEITYVTPLDGAFTKPVASKLLGGMLDERNIALESDFYIEKVDTERKAIVSYDEREIAFDLLVTVPLNMGAEFVRRSGLGDELNYVPVDKHTFVSKDWNNIFALGDAADLPTSKAGSVAHFAVEVFTDNFLEHIEGRPMTESFDGHANCFIETGDGKAMLLDFNYETEPLPGKYPIPGIGPMSLLEETDLNHWGKLMFHWVYWNVLLHGRGMPLRRDMSMAGKHPVDV